jgi:hypothetical protein
MPKYKIYCYTSGKYGYKTFYMLMQWNTVYNRYYSIKESIEMTFIESYCIMNKIDYKSIEQKICN